MATEDATLTKLYTQLAEAIERLESKLLADRTETQQQLDALAARLEGLAPDTEPGDTRAPAATPATQTAALEARLARMEQTLAERDAELERVRAEARAEAERMQATLREREARLVVLEEQARRGRPESTALPATIPAFDERGHKKRIGQILVDLGIATEEELRKIVEAQATDPQRRFGMIAIEHGLTDEELIGRIIAAQARLDFVRLTDGTVDPACVRLLHRDLATLYEAVPYAEADDRLRVAMANPLDLIALENIELATNRACDAAVAMPRDIETTIRKHLRK